MNSEQGPTLSVGNYIITSGSGGFLVWLVADLGQQEWLATASDPEIAMKIVEGLILVEMKRFYHPESNPKLTQVENKPSPPFLGKGVEKSQDQPYLTILGEDD